MCLGRYLVLCICLFTGLNVSAEFPPSCQPAMIPNSCQFYVNCLEARNQCGQGGYALGYGNKYCLSFNRLELSQQGEDWITGTMACLQGALIDVASRTSSCESIKQTAFKSHVKCYVDNGFCDLGLEDQVKISETVIWDVLTSVEGINQSASTLSECLRKKWGQD